MAARLYLNNLTSPYNPSATKGAWDITTSYINKQLGTGPGGTSTTRAQAETSSTTNWDVLLGQFISMPLAEDYSFSTSETVAWSVGVLESASAATDNTHIHIWVTTGDSSTPRGTLLTDSVADATAWPTTAASRYHSQNIGANVSALAGDRIVVEFGYRAVNTSSTSYTGTMRYGGSGTTDLNAADGDTAVTTRWGWVEFSSSPKIGRNNSAKASIVGLSVNNSSAKANIKSTYYSGNTYVYENPFIDGSSDTVDYGWDLGFGIQALAESFTGTASTLDSVYVWVKNTYGVEGSIYAYIYASTGSHGTDAVPTGSPLATSEGIDVSGISTSYVNLKFNFSGANRITLSAATIYNVVFYFSGASGTYVYLGFDSTSPTFAGNYSRTTSYTPPTTTWTPLTSMDMVFSVNKETQQVPGQSSKANIFASKNRNNSAKAYIQINPEGKKGTSFWGGTLFSDTDYTNIATINNTYVEVAGGSFMYYGALVFTKKVGSGCVTIKWTGKYNYPDSTLPLQIRNKYNDNYYTLDSSSFVTNTDFSIIGHVSPNDTQYLSQQGSDYWITVGVVTLSMGSNILYTDAIEFFEGGMFYEYSAKASISAAASTSNVSAKANIKSTVTNSNNVKTNIVVTTYQPSAPLSTPWYDQNWPYRIKITIPANTVDENLTDFPIYLKLGDLPSDFHTHVTSTAGDIRMTTSDGVTEIPREVVSYNSSTDTGGLYFKATISSYTSATYFYIYYGNSSASDYAVTATYGAQNAWNSGYKGVWHLEQDPSGTAPQILDSTSNDFDGTTEGSMTSGDLVDAVNGKGLDLDGSGDAIAIGDKTALNFSSAYTLESWFKKPGDTIDGCILSKISDGGASYSGYMLWRQASTNTVKLYINGAARVTSGTLSNDTWYYIAGSWDGTKVYVQRDLTVAEASYSTAPTSTGRSFYIGRYPDWPVQGSIDEIRVSNVYRSVAWRKASRANLYAPSSFYSLSTEEAALSCYPVKANIYMLAEKSVSAKADIKSTLTINLSSNANIIIYSTKNNSARANIILFPTKDISSKASIKVTNINNVSVCASIKVTYSINESAKASIITVDVSKNLSSKANIKVTDINEYSAKAWIKVTYTNGESAKANIIQPQRQWRSDDSDPWVYGYGDESNGDLAISTDTTISYAYAGIAATKYSYSGTLDSASTFSNGDLVLIHQTRGTGAGNWELNKIASGAGTTSITFVHYLCNTYTDSGASQAQIIELKQYRKVTIDSGKTLSAPAWDGNKGGILAFFFNRTLTPSGTLSASGKGFLGGAGAPIGTGYASLGEGTSGASATGTSLSVNNGNGAAAGKYSLSVTAGGGGGNAASGSTGGWAYSGPGAVGGSSSGAAALTTMTPGGGGGGASARGDNGTGGVGSAGKQGGGIIFIAGPYVDISSGNIVSNGVQGESLAYVSTYSSTGGGGGAGGSVLIKGETVILGSTSTATGGLGGVGKGSGGDDAAASGGAGSTGRFHVDYSVSISGTTNPTVDSRSDATIYGIIKAKDNSAKASIILSFSKENSSKANIKSTNINDVNSKANIGGVYSSKDVSSKANVFRNLYWVGGSGNWNDATNHWAQTSNGTPNALNFPTQYDHVHIDSNSGFSSGGTISLNGSYYSAVAGDFTSNSGHTYSISYSTSDLSIYGSFVGESGLSFAPGTYIFFLSNNSITINSNGTNWGELHFGYYQDSLKPTGTFTLTSDLSTPDTLYINSGTFDANNYSISAKGIDIRAISTYTISILMGSGNWLVGPNASSDSTFRVFSDGGSITLDSETSTVKIDSSSNYSGVFYGDGKTFYKVWFTGDNVTNYIYGSNTFNEITGDGSGSSLTIDTNTTQTVSIWSVNGSLGDNFTLDTPDVATDFYSGSLDNYWFFYIGDISKGGQSFTGNGENLEKVLFVLKKTGSITGNAVVEIYAETHSTAYGTDSIPTGGVLATSDSFDISTIGTSNSYTWFNFSGSNRIILEDGVKYIAVVSYNNATWSNHLDLAWDNTSPNHDGNACYYKPSSWYAQSDRDCYFSVRTFGSHTLLKSSGEVNASYLDISGSHASGGATWNALNSNNLIGNSGWIFKDISINNSSKANITIFGEKNISAKASISGGNSFDIYSKANIVLSYQSDLFSKSNIIAVLINNYSVKTDILNTYLNGASAKASIVVTTIFNYYAKASIITTNNKDLSSKASIVVSNSKNYFAKASIVVTTQSNFFSKADILVITTKNNSAKASIVGLSVNNSSAKANIRATTTQDVNSKADILSTISSNLSSKAHIYLIMSKDISSKASIVSTTQKDTFTRASIFVGGAYPVFIKANILVKDNLVNENVKANIVVTNNKNESSKANIVVTNVFNNNAKANIVVLNRNDESVKANILVINNKNLFAKADILALVQNELSSKSNIVTTVNNNTSSKASIYTSFGKDFSVKANILTQGVFGQSAKALIFAPESKIKDVYSKSNILVINRNEFNSKVNIVVENSNNESSKASILTTNTKDVSVKTDILRTYNNNEYSTSNIVRTENYNFSSKSNILVINENGFYSKASIVTTNSFYCSIKSNIVVTNSFEEFSKASIVVTNSKNESVKACIGGRKSARVKANIVSGVVSPKQRLIFYGNRMRLGWGVSDSIYIKL